MPHLGVDPIVAGGAGHDGAADDRQPQHPSARKCVVSVTQIHGGDTWNVIPGRGRAARHGAHLQAEVQDRDRAPACAGSPKARGRARRRRELRYERRYPATVNSGGRDRDRGGCSPPRSSAQSNVDRDLQPTHGRRGFRLHAAGEARCYIWIGNGAGENGGGCTTRITISTTRSCRSARAIGLGWSSAF